MGRKDMYKKTDIKDVYTLTPMQQGMLYHFLVDEKSRAYFQQTTFEINGNLDIKVFEESFNKVIERHDALKTAILYEKLQKPLQIVLKERKAKIHYEEITYLKEEEKEKYIKNFQEKDKEKGFHLSKEILIRMSVIKIQERKYKVIWSFHHILMDGWCLGIIMKDFFRVYESLKNHKEITLEDTYPYGSFIRWLEIQDKKEGERYWKEYLHGYEDKVAIPKSVNEDNSYIGKEKSVKLSKELTSKIEKLTKENQVTINTFFQSIWGILLQKYNNVEDVVFGSVVSGRNAKIKGIENMVGLFINTIPVRIQGKEDTSFMELIKKVQEEGIKGREYDYSSLADIQENTSLKENLIDHIMVFENYPIEDEISNIFENTKRELTIGNVENHEHTNYDFGISILPGEEIGIRISYNEKVYSSERMNRILVHIENIIEEGIKNPEIKIKDIQILSKEEIHTLLVSYNDTEKEYPKNKTIQELIEEVAQNNPNEIAVVEEDKKYTYKELNEKANHIAKEIRKKGIKREDIVALSLERSIEMIIGILGVLKAGGGYLPIDPEIPKDRKDYILKDSGAKLLLTQKHLEYKGEIKQRYIDKESLKESDENLENINKPHDLAYIIYTSGSTGNPKGVMIEHSGVVNLCKWLNSKYDFKKNKNIAQMTNYTFDVSIEQIFGGLINGATVFLMKKETLMDKALFYEFIEKNKINIIQFVPITLRNLLLENKKMNSLKVVTCGGEKLEDTLKDAVLEKGYNLYNHYGPTEITVDALSIKCTKEKVTIGKPIDNTKVYVLDKYNKLLPIGAVGELCISGAGLARGYLNKPTLTKEKFVENPYDPKRKMYKSGDLVKWNEAGNIEFIGRVDDQVKIRGFRIETGEIENRILKYEGIKEAVVIKRKEEEEYLCAYFVGEEKIETNNIKAEIMKYLPNYMIPAYFVQLEEIPLRSNKKIDKKALPNPEKNRNIEKEYVCGRNEIEEKLLKIYEEVLNLNQVGILDNFFELGGHSLKAMIVIGKIHKELGIKISIQELFKNPTVEKIGDYIQNIDKNPYEEIKAIDKKEYYETSSAQKRMYTLSQFEKNNVAYNMPGFMEIEGTLEKERLEKAFEKLVQRHEALRTTFFLVEDEVMQRIETKAFFSMEYKEESNGENIEKIVKSFVRPFDLENGNLFRVMLLKVKEKKHILLLDVHHIISDGISMKILMEEVVAFYENEEVKPLRIQYKDYALWQNAMTKKPSFQKQEKYWLEIFKGEIPVLNITTDYKRPKIQSFEGDSIQFEIKKEWAEKLKKLGKENDATLYMVLLTIYNLLLAEYSGQEDIIVGSPIAGRDHPDLENVMGMFVNTLAMRNYPKKDKSFIKLLKEVKENALKAYENQDYQFEVLVEKLNIKRDMSRNPLFDTLFSLENIEGKEINIKGLSFKPCSREMNIAKFDLTLEAQEKEETILFHFEYATKLFKKETIERLKNHFINIIKEVTENPFKKRKEIEMLSKEEKIELLENFNNTKAFYPKDKTFHELVEEVVEKTPDKIAVIYKKEKLTYKQLNEKANKLARFLRKKGIKNDRVVGIMVDRCVEMIIGILGVLKAGGAYLPIDPEYPQDRIAYMLEDSKAEILLTEERLREKIYFDKEILDIKEDSLYQGEGSNLENINNPHDLVYIIYTSGTTGKPKGVMVEHKNLINIAYGWKKEYHLETFPVKLLQMASMAFDVFAGDLGRVLLNGGEMIICPSDIRVDPPSLYKIIKEKEINIFEGTPALIIPLMEYIDENNLDINNLKLLILGSDCCMVEDFKKLNKRFSNKMRILNSYGVTEGTIDSSFYEIKENMDENGNVPIGKPMQNVRFYILDEALKPKGIGIRGELYISGEGISRGYLGKEKLTKEKFIKDPFVKDAIMYKTGDLARWTNNGDAVFLGRIDHQVKIRGYRMELGEIENSILTCDKVKDAAVIAKEEDMEKYLCAYVVMKEELSIENLKKELAQKLPEYMIPAYFIKMEALPLTPNKKVDRKALPDINKNIEKGESYEAPKNEIEKELVNIWEEVLKIKGIGIKDNFFDLGGHSLKATAMAAKIHKKLKVEVPLREIFKTPTIQNLSKYIKALEENTYEEIKRIHEGEYYPVSSIQKRIYTLSQLETENTTYNMPGFMEIEGIIDKEKLEKGFLKLIERHEALRTSFEWVEGEILQKIHKNFDFKLLYQEGKEATKKYIKDFIKPFDLTKAPLFRVGLIKIKENKHILMVDMHHIISDGRSVEILTHDFLSFYEGKEVEKLKIQYKDYAVWEKDKLKEEKIKKQESYWLKTFEGEIPLLNMPTDYKRPGMKSSEGGRYSFTIEADLYEKLKHFARENEMTLYMLLLSSFSLCLSKYSNQEDMIIGTVTQGRNSTQTDKLVGVFLNNIAFRCMPKKNKRIKEYLKEVKERVIEGYENQSYPIEEIIEKLNIKRDLSRNALFDVMLIHQNYEKEEINTLDWKIKSYPLEHKVSDYDMTLYMDEEENKIMVDIEYYSKIFKESTIKGFAEHLLKTMNKIVENPKLKVRELNIITKEEKEKIVGFSGKNKYYEKEKTLQAGIENQVIKTPAHTALIYKDKKITYKELNEKANQLGRKLREKGIEKENIVGIMTEKSIEMVIGMLAILKAGGTYLPIDPDYPKERIKYMLEDSEVKILLTQKKLKKGIEFNKEIIDIEDEKLYVGEKDNLENINESRDLAYIIYTSGTTGKPKGIMTSHKNVIAYITEFNERFQLGEKDITLQQASITFDGFNEEVYTALTVGGCVVIPEQEIVKEGKALKKLIDYHGVTILSCSPLIMSSFNKLEPMKTVHTYLSSSDILKKEYYNNIIKYAKVYNMYGPTETTVCATCYSCSEKEEGNISIGKPLGNYYIYILDEDKNIQPIGIPGEIYIAGEGISRGYKNNEKLTKEKFIENPFKKDTRMYKTGDMGRWLPNGNIDFLGRKDNQVKIRGYRIEIGEIERKLLAHENIKEVIVLTKEGEKEEKYLVAYFVGDKELTIGALRKYLMKDLPEFMVPSYMIQIEKMPLNLNGKIDKKLLPPPEKHIRSEAIYEKPRNEIEEKLVKIWEAILKVEKIGINDNFFELGGHSLRGTIMASRIHKELKVEIPLKEIFKSQTIKELSAYIKALDVKEYEDIQVANKREYYPVSSTQKRIYIIEQFNEWGTSYNTPAVIILEGIVEKGRIESAFKKLVDRHEGLRTSFHFIGEEIVQKVHEDVDFEMEYEEIKENEADKKVKAFIKPFDLKKAPLFKVALLKTGEKKYILMMDMHHIITDGTSIEILIDEFVKLYHQQELKDLRIQYKDYAVWQNALMKSERFKKQENYWLKIFEGEIPILNMPTDFQRPEIQSSEGDTYTRIIDKELSQEIIQFAREKKATLFTFLLGIYSIVLMKYADQEDIVIGTVTAGRTNVDIQKVIGVFLNNIAFRCKPNKDKSFESYLDELKENVLNAYDNQQYPIEELIEKINVKKDMSRNTLFDVMIILQNFESEVDEIAISDIKARSYPYEGKTAKCDMTFYILEANEQIELNFEYCTKLFKEETIKQFTTHFIQIAKEVMHNPSKEIKDISILSQEEIYELTKKFNGEKIEYPKDKTIHEQIEVVVENNPDEIALVYEDKSLTYRELNEKANKVARYLRKKGVKRESIVGIMMERSLDMIVGILAILKAGGGYLPIDSEYPLERIHYMLRDSKAQLLLTQEKLIEKIEFEGEIISIKEKEIEKEEATNLDNINRVEDLIYVIYTSGTTGKPKGVMVEHKNLLNIAYGWKKDYHLENFPVRLLQMASMAFDVFAGDFVRVLLNGGKMIICPSDIRVDPISLYKTIREYEINIFESTPSLIIPLMEYVYENNLKMNNLKLLIMGSDSCPIEEFKKLKKRFSKDMRILNSYGVTEATIDSSFYESEEEVEGIGSVSIGKPMQNVQFYILDEYLQLKGMRQYGELYIGGEGVARGYLGKEALTKEKFIENPFEKGEKIYKTGDLARWRESGNVEFLGRMDHQVKIRGYRIELGEIESTLLSYEGIKDAVVMPWGEKEDKYLCAYVVKEKEIEIEKIRNFLAQSLPEYMIPNRFMDIKEIPLTPNNKVDRKALPEPLHPISFQENYVEPRNEIEKELVRIWEALLNTDKIGVKDNFFELGGHSLKATMMVGKIYKEMGFELPLKEVFKIPTIREIGNYIKKEGNKEKTYGDEQIIPLKKVENKKQHVFFIHDISGDVTGYADFCSYITADVNCWGIKGKIENHYAPRNKKIEEIAREYIEKLKTIQDKGPYYIGGWSIGGVIAFEMVKQLEEKGELVRKLWLFDTEAPDENYIKNKKKESFTVNTEKEFIQKTLLRKKIFEKEEVESEEKLWKKAVAYMKENNWDTKELIAAGADFVEDNISGYEEMNLPEMVKYMNHLRGIENAVDHYLPSEKVKTDIMLIKAKESNWLKPKKWKIYTEGDLEVIPIDGNHYSIFKEPRVENLAKLFDDSIKEKANTY